MKILYVTTVGGTMTFFKSFVSNLLAEGNTVDIATNTSISKVPAEYTDFGCKVYEISTSRSPFASGNIKAIKQIRQLAKNYDLVHCHTPIAAACTRIACKGLRKSGLKVIYTAHGFHFYKGAPLKNWLIYYPVERICSHFTDVLITINKEDYDLAKRKMKAKRVEYVPGVGIDVDKFANTSIDKQQKKESLSIPASSFLFLSVGELNENKNHKIVLEAMSKMADKSFHYAIAGQGDLLDDLREMANNLGIGDRVHLLGFRSDVNELYNAADAFILPSIREGLNVSTMEAMASGLPCIVSKIRGNTDLVDPVLDGLYFDPFDADSVAASMTTLLSSENIDEIKKHNINKAENYRYSEINKKLKEIYSD